MVPKINIFSNRLFRHIFYWIGFTSGFALIWGTHDNDFMRSFIIQIFALPSRMLLVYITLYFLVPRLLLKRKIVLFILGYVFLLVGITICIQRPIMLFYVQPNYLSDWISMGYFNIVELMNTLLDINHAIIVPMVVIFFEYYNDEQKKALLLERERFKTELYQLRSQIHPHFLFNTLNSLYSLIIKKSVKAEGAVVKLSGLLRYMIYEANVPKVPLSKEMEYLKNYIELEQLRFDKKAKVIFESSKDREYELSPFMLIPFIENAFKHSPNSPACNVLIQLTAENGVLQLEILNQKSKGNVNKVDGSEGIGLTNIKKRLELLYKNKHELQFDENDTKYQVKLNLNLF